MVAVSVMVAQSPEAADPHGNDGAAVGECPGVLDCQHAAVLRDPGGTRERDG